MLKAAPLSFAQEEVWWNNKLTPGDVSYNFYKSVAITGNLQVSLLCESLNEIIRRHSILRTYFIEKESNPVQKIVNEISIIPEEIDFSHLAKEQQKIKIKKYITNKEEQAYDLEKPPLLRVSLLKLNKNTHILIMNFHHIIADAKSISLFFSELFELYSKLLKGESSSLKPLSIQYADFSRWERKYYTEKILQERYLYWKELLRNQPAPLKLLAISDKPATSKRKVYKSGVEVFPLASGDTIPALKKLARSQGTTLSIALLSVYIVMLCQHSGQYEMIIGMPTNKRSKRSNHDKPKVNDVIGYFTGMSILRIQLKKNYRFTETLANVHGVVKQALLKQDLTLKQVLNGLKLPLEGEEQLLFRTVFNFIPVTGNEEVRISDKLTSKGLTNMRKVMVRDLVIGVWDKDGSGENFDAYLRYRQDILEKETILKMIKTYQHLLEFFSRDAHQSISAHARNNSEVTNSTICESIKIEPRVLQHD